MPSLPERILSMMTLEKIRPGRPGTFSQRGTPWPTVLKTVSTVSNVEHGERGESSDDGVQGDGQKSALAHNDAAVYCSHNRVCKETIFKNIRDSVQPSNSLLRTVTRDKCGLGGHRGD